MRSVHEAMEIDALLPALLRSPDHPAFVTRRGTRVTRGALAERALAVAASLHRRGLTEGDTVALAVRPGPAALAVVLAALRLRLRVALVDPAVPPDLLTARLRSAQATVVLTDPLVRAAAGWAAPVARRAGLRLAPLDAIAPVIVLPRRLPAGPSPDRSGSNSDALVVFTSGTTGRPRAVVHTTESLSAGLRAVAGITGVRRDETVVASTFFAMAPALLAGAPVATSIDRRTMEALTPRLTYVTPPQARDLLDAGTRLTGRVFTGSAPASARLLTRLRERGAEEAWGVYALTEAFPVAAVEARTKSAFAAPGDLVGDLVPGMSARTDDTGQVLLTGPNTCDSYLGEPPVTEVMTGDRGTVEPGGSVVLHGRLKDMVLRRAENIYPGLHEPSLLVPGVAQALLVGVPTRDPDDRDERLVLVVEPEPGVPEGEVRRRLRGPLAALGPARPDEVLVAPVPLAGRSRKPDRAATAALAAAVLDGALT